MRVLRFKNESLAWLVAMVVMLGFAGVTNAAPISAGYDLFSSQPGTEIDLTGVGLGIVPLEGDPIGPGNTDTIIERLAPAPPINGGDTGTIDIELVALSLISVDPVDLTPLGGPLVGVFADLYVTVNRDGIISGLAQPDTLPSSTGEMDITVHDDLNTPADGLFSSDLSVFADVISAVVGGDPDNPFDVIFSQVAPEILLSSLDSVWSHTAPAGDQHNAMFPAGNFYVTSIDHDGPHPVVPSTPVPAAVWVGLALFGFMGVSMVRHKQHRA